MRSRAIFAGLLALAAAGTAAHPGRLAAVQDPVSPHGTLSARLDCSACHTGSAWVPARDPLEFDHDRETTFPLDGSHVEAGCASCHLSLRFDEPKGIGSECSSCHIDVHSGSLGSDCASCHDTESFVTVPGPDQHALTAFPLAGAHDQIGCESCHTDDRGGLYSGADTECISCHLTEYETAELVDHAGFPTDCLECHTTDAWRAAPRFDHTSRGNGFPLLGAHEQVGCEGCHIRPGNELKFVPAGESDCIACHQTDYNREHQGPNFPTECLECHTRSGWDADEIDPSLTGFPLVGVHIGLDCSECHGAGNVLRFPTPAAPEDCVSCHRADYDDEHAGSNFPTTCLDCHTTSDWDAEAFDHATTTGFDLVGSHGALQCESCHRPADGQLLFSPPATQDDCFACHRTDYDAEHTGSGFATTCLDCHTTSGWDGAQFNHTQTGFDLVGSHRTLGCESCHRPSDNQLIFPPPAMQDDCVACHQADYDAEHQGSSFPTTCLDCHDTTAFTGAVFDHDALFFPISTGKHKAAVCQDCHTVPNDFRVFSCLTCHEHRQSEVDSEHKDVSGYVYQSSACFSCHPDGKS